MATQLCIFKDNNFTHFLPLVNFRPSLASYMKMDNAQSPVFGFGFTPKFIPSFSWGGSIEMLTTYDIEKAIDVARRVKARRKVEFTAAEENIFREVFASTIEERHRLGMKV